MIRENNIQQIQLFATPFEQELDLENRWVKFSKILPWNALDGYYYARMDKSMGAGTIAARIILGALIIKHHESLRIEVYVEHKTSISIFKNY